MEPDSWVVCFMIAVLFKLFHRVFLILL